LNAAAVLLTTASSNYPSAWRWWWWCRWCGGRRPCVDIRVDPIVDVMDASPNSWIVLPCTAPAPRRGTVNGPSPRRLAHERAATVTLASVSDTAVTVPPLRTEHGIGDLRAGVPRRLALLVAEDLDRSLLEDIGRTAARRQCAPPRDPACRARCHIIRPWEAHRANAPIHLHGARQPDQAEVMVGGGAIVPRMIHPTGRSHSLLIATRSPNIPFASDHPDPILGLAREAMCCCENPLRRNEHPSAPRSSRFRAFQAHLPFPRTLWGILAIHDGDVGPAQSRPLNGNATRALIAGLSLPPQPIHTSQKSHCHCCFVDHGLAGV